MISTADTRAMVEEIDRLLVGGGFVEIKGPLTVSGVPFEVMRAYAAGPGFLDLVVVVDATDGTTRQLRHSYWLVERIAQALDQANSRRPLTAIVLHDAAAARVPTEDFLRLGRVLLVTDVDNVGVELAPILPIVLESSAEAVRDPLETLQSGVGSGRDAAAEINLIEAARLSADRVQSVLVDWVDDPFSDEGEAE